MKTTYLVGSQNLENMKKDGRYYELFEDYNIRARLLDYIQKFSSQYSIRAGRMYK